MYGTTNGKIIKRRNKTGYSYNFLIVKNKRHPMTGKAVFDTIWNFGTIRSTETKNQANAFWAKVELVSDSLVYKGKIYANDADKLRRQFAKYIPFPVAVLITKPKANPIVAERLKERFKGLI